MSIPDIKSSMTVNITDLYVSYGNTPALNGLRLILPSECRVFGLLGRNGAGKTTTIRAMLGLVKPSSGSVNVFGMNPCENPDLRKKISVLFAEDGLVKELTLFENLVLWAKLYGFSGIDAKKSADEIIEVLNIRENRNRKAGDLSAGNKRISALARTFLPKADLVILDEPTSSLDPVKAVEVRERIKQLSSRSRIIISTHNLAEAEELSDRIAIIHEGKVAAYGTPDELGKKGSLFKVKLETSKPVILHGVQYSPDNQGFLTISCSSDQSACDLLNNLIVENKLRVVEFKPVRSSLAEAFLETTSYGENA